MDENAWNVGDRIEFPGREVSQMKIGEKLADAASRGAG